MGVDKINVWSDARVQRRNAIIHGRTYGYLFGEPRVQIRGTVFLIHGFPDLAVGWRYQIPHLLQLGLRVVAPDMMGYGNTDAPPFTLREYSYRQAANDISELAKQLGLNSIILGGHDWGGAVVYRTALYHPNLVSHVFAVCTPYFPPNPVYKPLALVTQGRYASFEYQKQFASGEIEETFCSKIEIKCFLNAMYRPWGQNMPFHPPRGVDVGACFEEPPTELLSADELDYYALQYARNGLHGPLNWYRTREQNYIDELDYFFQGSAKSAKVPVLQQEILLIMGVRDTSLLPEMSSRMSSMIPHLTTNELEATHWILWERPDEVNKILRDWFEEKVFHSGVSSKL